MVLQTKRNFKYFTYIEPVLKTPAIKTYGSLIFTIIAMIIFILFAIKPTIETIVLLQKDLENQKEVLSKINKKVETINTGRANYERINSETKLKIESLLPKIPDLPGLIKVLEQSVSSQASISAIQLQPISIEKPSQTTATSIVTEVKFTFNVGGSYEGLKEVLQKLHAGSRLISITQLIFNRVEGGNGLIMSITGHAYYLK